MRTNHHMNRLASGVLAFGLLGLLAGCGDDSSSDVDLGSDVGAPSDPSDSGAGSPAESDVTVTVDGQEYVVTTVQSCTTEGDDRSDLTMFGFAETGERVELSFRQQDADTSPTGAAAYYGSVGIASGQIKGQATSDEPFPFLEGDRSSVRGSVTMESTVGDASTPVEVSFDITCP